MIVLVPLSRFRITYEVAAGRPFSEFERLMLRAIKEGVCELSELRETFQVHPRLLIEGLVTLTHAGWLAIGGPGHEGFVLTSDGQEAATSHQAPSTTVVASRQASVVMERLTGALILNSEVRFATRRELRDVWDRAIRLVPEVADNQLDEGQVQHFLPRRQGEWLRWIGPIDMLTKGANWLPVSVDVQAEVLVGLPDAWIPRLQKAVLTRAREVEVTKSPDEMEGSFTFPVRRQQRSRESTDAKESSALQLPEKTWPARISEKNLCFTFAEHEDLLEEAMNDAQSSVFVAAPFPSVERMEVIRSRIEGALKRRVNVDLLFGEMKGGADDFRAVTNFCGKMAYCARQDGWGVLRFSREPSNFHGNLLAWDSTGGCMACVGSYSWFALSDRGGDSSVPRDVTIRVSEPGIVASLVRYAIGIWSAVESEVLSSTGDRWRGIAAELDRVSSQEAIEHANAKLRLVLDGEHEVLVDIWQNTAKSRLFVASHELGTLWNINSGIPSIELSEMFRVDIVYGRTERKQAWMAEASKSIGERGGVVRKVENFRGEVLIADATACVTSYCILGSDGSRGASGGREIGVIIEGKQFVDWLWNKLTQMASPDAWPPAA